MRRAATAVVDFVVGDDGWVAVGIFGAVVVTDALTEFVQVDAWWLLPSAVPVIVALSLARVARRRPTA